MHEPRLYDNPQLSVVCVSIGTPEKALLVCDNLGIDKDLLYVDPEADVHRKLGLEKSIQSTFLSPQTPLAMKKILVDDFAKYVSAPLRRKRARLLTLLCMQVEDAAIGPGEVDQAREQVARAAPGQDAGVQPGRRPALRRRQAAAEGALRKGAAGQSV